MQTTTSSSAAVGNSSQTSQEHPLSPEAVRRIVFYLVLGAAAGLSALKIELPTSLEETAPFETLPPPASQPERSH
jgi:hypothetical protein